MIGLARWRALGTNVDLLVSRGDLAVARAADEETLALVDATYSRFRPESELVGLNARPGATVRVSPLLARAITLSLRAAELTGGLVDPSVGRLTSGATAPNPRGSGAVLCPAQIVHVRHTVRVTVNVLPPAPDAHAADPRAALANELIDELAGWSPPDRLRAFIGWHRGSLSLVHLIVLTVLEADGPLPMRRLADALDVSDASATGIADRMEKHGYVERRHGTEDRREVLVHLTDAGTNVFHELQQRRRTRLTTMVDQLTDDELASLLTGLRAMRAAVVRLHAERGADAGAAGAAR